MLIKGLGKNIVIKELVNRIIADKEFKKKCEFNFKKIFEGGKVDRGDIPLIINLFLVIYKNQSKVKKNLCYIIKWSRIILNVKIGRLNVKICRLNVKIGRLNVKICRLNV
jgi:hypothetical protein